MKLESGHRFDPNADIIGIAGDCEPRIYGGYDESYMVTAGCDEPSDEYDMALTRADVDEIADEMLIRWQIFKNRYGTKGPL